MTLVAGEEEWLARLRSTPPIPKATMNRLVMDYLVIEGHKEAAECFRAESGTPAGLDLETISDRRAIRTAIEGGEVAQAIEHADRVSPELLSGSPELCFRVLQQQLIELVRGAKVEEAIGFAQKELAPRAEASGSLLSELQRTMMLIAYEDANACPEADLLSQSQRQRTASRLNAALLAAQAQEKEAALPMMLRRLHWAQDELSQRQRCAFPRIDDYDLAQLSVAPSAADEPPIDASSPGGDAVMAEAS